MLIRAAEEGEHRHRIQVARLLLAFREVDRATVDARRGAGLQAALRQLQLLQAGSERDRRRIAGAAGGVVVQADVDQPVQEGARGEHHSPRAEADADLRDRADDALALDDQVVDRLLEEPKVGLVLQAGADRLAVENAIGLRAGRADGRALARVEDAELDAGFVGRRRHRAAERIDLLDQVALPDAADRRVARHLAERLDAVREQQRRAAHSCRGERGLGPGMAATDDDDVEFLGEEHGAIRECECDAEHGARGADGGL